MAKQAGLIKISGTIGDITFYRLYEEHYARTKSSLSGKRVKQDPGFKETMKHDWTSYATPKEEDEY